MWRRTLVEGISGDRPCESINRKLRPLSVPCVPPIQTPKAEPPSNGNRNPLPKRSRLRMALDATLRPRKLHCPTDPARPSKTRNRGGTAGSRFQNQRRNPRFGLGSPKLSWAGLGCARWRELGRLGWADLNAAAGRPDTGQTRTENEQNEETPQLDVRVCRPAAGRAGLGWAPKQRNAAARRPQTGQKRTKNGAVSRPKMGTSESGKKSLWQRASE